MELLIQDVLWQGRRVDVAIAEGVFTAIEPAGTLEPTPSTTCLSGRHFLLRSPFYNTHTHHAMTLLRGAGEDLPLMAWLQERIWSHYSSLIKVENKNVGRLGDRFTAGFLYNIVERANDTHREWR